MDIQTIGLIIGSLVLAYFIGKNIINYYKTTYVTEEGRFNNIKFSSMMMQYLYILIIIFIIIFILTITATSETGMGRNITLGTSASSTVSRRGVQAGAENAINMAKIAVSTYPVVILGFLIVFSISLWTMDKVTLEDRNCTAMDIKYPVGGSSLTSYVTSREFLENDMYNIFDFYYKTAYNCCCAGNYKNDYVSLCALKHCINAGARCLDFEIYSVNNEPVIAASSSENFTIKETYNAIPFYAAMEVIRDNAFSSGCPCAKDPLFLNFRIKSKQQDIYNQMAKDLSNTLAPKLLDKKYSYQYKLNGKIRNFGKVPLKDVKGKVVIMVDGRSSLFVETKLEEFVNIATSTGGIMQSVRYDTVKGSSEPMEEYIDYNRTKMTICLPNLSSQPKNFPSFTAMNNGCQFVAMCFQKKDSNLDYYTDTYFKNYPIMLKPLDLRVSVSVLTLPDPIRQNMLFEQPNQSFGPVGMKSFSEDPNKL